MPHNSVAAQNNVTKTWNGMQRSETTSPIWKGMKWYRRQVLGMKRNGADVTNLK